MHEATVTVLRPPAPRKAPPVPGFRQILLAVGPRYCPVPQEWIGPVPVLGDVDGAESIYC
jgi:hypothetical protein